MARTLPKDAFAAASHDLRRGSRGEPLGLAESLVHMGYESASSVTAPGQFARRGGILDVWAMQDEFPSRLEFFGNEIDSLRRFDPGSQRTIEEIEAFRLSPAREYLLSDDGQLGVEPNDLTEFHVPLLHPDSVSVFDYLPEHAIICIDDREALEEQISELETQAVALREEGLQNGTIDSSYPLPYVTLDDLQDLLAERQVIELGPADELEEAQGLAHLFRPGPRFGGQLKPMLDHVERMLDNGDEVQMVSRQAARLQDLWKERSFASSRVAQPIFKEGSLGDGWTLKPGKGAALHLLTDSEIFGWERPQPRQRHARTRSPRSCLCRFESRRLGGPRRPWRGAFQRPGEATIEGAQREFLPWSTPAATNSTCRYTRLTG